MKAWGAAVTAAAFVAASAAWAATGDNAKPRGGGDSASAGARHHSGSSGDKGDTKSSSSSSSSDSSSSSKPSSSGTPTGPQLRHPRAGTGTGYKHGHYGPGWGYYPPYYGYGYGYGYYDPFWYGSGWYAPYFGVGYYGGHQHNGYSSYPAGEVRVLVQPSEARVYVDGYYAGIVDDFDGIFQRLHLAPGGHDISLRLEGFRTHNVKLYVPYEGTIKLRHKMVKGTGEDTGEVVGRPEAYARLEGPGSRSPAGDPGRAGEPGGERALLRLEVRPSDASVYVDGAFAGTARDMRQLRLSPGRHRIEVVRPGYRTVEREVEVAPGETQDLDIALERG